VTSLFFLVGVFLQGLLWALVHGRELGVRVCALVAFPLGLLIWVALCLVFLLTPLPFGASGLFGVWTVLGGVAVVRLSSASGQGGRVAVSEWRELVIGLLMFVLLAAGLTHWNLAVLTVDSLAVIDKGRMFAFYGLIEGGHALSTRGVFMSIAQGSSVLIGVDYLPALAPLLGLCLLGSFVFLGARALADRGAAGDEGMPRSSGSRWALGAAILAGLAMMSPYFMILQLFYVHANLPAALYLFLFAACFALAEREGESAWLVFAFAFLLGFCLQRVEAPIIALVMATLSWSRARVDPSRLMLCLITFASCLTLWLVVVWLHAGPESRILKPAQSGVLVLVSVGFVPALWVMERESLHALRRRVPELVLVTLALLCGVAWMLRPEAALDSLAALLTNVTSLHWGAIWLVVLALGLPGLLLARPVGQRVLLHAGLAYLMSIQLAGVARKLPYQPTWQDSGNRMLVHALPLLMFWLLLAYGPSIGEYLERRSRRSATPS
jgi:hypothetical protein